MAKTRILQLYTMEVFSLAMLLLNITNVRAVADEEISKLQSQMETFAQRIVALEQKDFEKQQIIAKQQIIIKEQGDTIAKIQRYIIQQSHTVTELQSTVNQQYHYIRKQRFQLTSIRKHLQNMKKSKRPQDMISIKPSSSEESFEPKPSIPTSMFNNRIQSQPAAFQNDQINRKRIVNTVAEPIAFMARVSTVLLSHVGVNQIIPFDSVLLNLGNSYHSQHGVFIAPQSGIYLFSSSIMSNYVNHVEVSAAIVQNGNTVARLYAHSDSEHWDQGAQTVIIQVKQGDEIWIKSINIADNMIYGGLYSTFSGYLLLPM